MPPCTSHRVNYPPHFSSLSATAIAARLFSPIFRRIFSLFQACWSLSTCFHWLIYFFSATQDNFLAFLLVYSFKLLLFSLIRVHQETLFFPLTSLDYKDPFVAFIEHFCFYGEKEIFFPSIKVIFSLFQAYNYVEYILNTFSGDPLVT